MPKRNRNSYLMRKYGITEKEYQQMLTTQCFGCKICGNKPKTNGRRLHVDHDHAVEKLRIGTKKRADGRWISAALVNTAKTNAVMAVGATRSEAIQNVRKQLLRASVRGLLCWHCNTLLQKARDNHEILRNAAKYIEEYKGAETNN